MEGDRVYVVGLATAVVLVTVLVPEDVWNMVLAIMVTNCPDAGAILWGDLPDEIGIIVIRGDFIGDNGILLPADIICFVGVVGKVVVYILVGESMLPWDIVTVLVGVSDPGAVRAIVVRPCVVKGVVTTILAAPPVAPPPEPSNELD